MSNHPSKEELSGFLLGELAPDATDSVAEHIGECAPCQNTLTDLEAHNDTLVKGLQKPAPAEIDAIGREAVRKIGAAPPGNGPPNAPRNDAQPSLTTAAQAAAQPREKFVASLVASGVIDADDWAQLQKTNAAVAQAPDGQALARALVQCGALSKFQASAIYQGKIQGLVYGEYAVVDLLGEGGMGQVFKARHRSMDRVVALKVLAKKAVDSPAGVKRFQREVKAAARLIHPNIVTAFDAGKHAGIHFLVMEFVPGSDLSALVKQQGPLPPAQASRYILQAARGLAFAHSQGVVHRDIKPANLLVDSAGVVKILDMGLARLDVDPADAGAGDGLTQTGQIMGTVDYMAPEQAFDTSKADAKSDMYSLGCTLYRLLTGANVFAGDSLMQKLLAHREQPIPSLRAARPEVSAALDAIYRRMVAKQPSDRPTMTELIAELESLERGESTTNFVPTTIVKESSSDSLFALPAIDTSPKPRPQAKDSTAPTFEQKPGSKTLGGNRTTGAKTAGRGRRPPTKNLLIGAAAAGAAALLYLGITVVFKDKDGKPIATAGSEAAASVEIFTTPTAPASPTGQAPVAGAPSSTPLAPGGSTAVASGGPATQSQATATIIPAEALTFDGHRYLPVEPVNNGIGWIESKAKAEAMGGHLATVNTREELDWIRATFRKLPATNDLERDQHRFWLGGQSGTEKNDPWTWVTGEPFDRSLWVGNGPDGAPDPPPYALSWYGDVWDDAPLHTLAPFFLVEWDTPGPTALAPTTTANGTKPPASNRPLDLLPLVDLSRDLLEGEWAKDGAGFTTTKLATNSWLRLPVDPGEAYSLRVAFSTKRGNLSVVLPFESKGLHIAFSPTRVAIALKWNDPTNPQATVSPDTNDGKRHEALIQVTRPSGSEVKIAVAVDGQPALEWQGTREQLRAIVEKPGVAATLSIGSYLPTEAPAKLIEAQLTATAGAVKLLRGTAPAGGAAALGGSTALPPGKLFLHDPAFGPWMKDVQAMPAAQQIEAVRSKLMLLNPGFDGALSSSFAYRLIGAPQVEDGAVTKLAFFTDHVTDISPVKSLSRLESLVCRGSKFKGILTDVSPLAGLRLTTLDLAGNKKLSELAPLKGLPLVDLDLWATNAADLTPLSELRLTKLNLRELRLLKDLRPLAAMPLTELDCVDLRLLTDLSPLAGMRLKRLKIAKTNVSDLAPLRGMPLDLLEADLTPLANLSPLGGLPLTSLTLSECSNVADLEPLAECKSLKILRLMKTPIAPAAVAALQKALPDCKIEWDDPAKPRAAAGASGTK